MNGESSVNDLGLGFIHSSLDFRSDEIPVEFVERPIDAALCKAKNLPHVVNNAYGVQCSKYTHLVNEGSLLFFRPPLGLSLLL